MGEFVKQPHQGGNMQDGVSGTDIKVYYAMGGMGLNGHILTSCIAHVNRAQMCQVHKIIIVVRSMAHTLRAVITNSCIHHVWICRATVG